MFSAGLVERCRKWVVDALGEGILTDRRERAMRHAEEALELAQALGVSRRQAENLVGRVWSRPAGTPRCEAAGSLFTLVVLASEIGVDLELELYKELERVEDPVFMARVREKHAEKVLRGIGRPL